MDNDAELLRASRRRPDAFVDVCERHAADLAGWLRSQVGPDAAEDLLAETFARAWYARRRFRDPGTGSAGPWLQGIARNLVGDFRRRGAIETRARRRLGLLLEPVAVESEEWPIASLLAELPVEQRDALELRFVDDLDYTEIGRRLAVAPATARTRVHRALKTLRRQTGRSES